MLTVTPTAFYELWPTSRVYPNVGFTIQSGDSIQMQIQSLETGIQVTMANVNHVGAVYTNLVTIPANRPLSPTSAEWIVESLLQSGVEWPSFPSVVWTGGSATISQYPPRGLAYATTLLNAEEPGLGYPITSTTSVLNFGTGVTQLTVLNTCPCFQTP